MNMMALSVWGLQGPARLADQGFEHQTGIERVLSRFGTGHQVL
jgi:hypothetical protein